jgi:hypothetical protein
VPVYPIVRELPVLTGNYPQMARRDARIWEAFLREHPLIFEEVAYNVALGGRELTGQDEDEATLRGWQYATAKKVDAVCWRRDEIWMVEVKPNASLSSIGQVLGYVILAQVDGFPTLPLRPIVITDQVDADVAFVAETLGVQIIIADPDRSVLAP